MKTNLNKINSIKLLWCMLLTLLLFNTIALCQETPPPTEFPIGVFMSIRDITHRTNPALYNSFYASGMNTIVQHADDNTKPYLTNPNIKNLIADNGDSPEHWLTHYASGFYSKWEAEENQEDLGTVGVKHTGGSISIWKSKNCWSSTGLTGPQNSLMYGPDYHQEKVYRRWYYHPWIDPYNLTFTPRINMALNNPQSVPGNEDVCRIKIVHRYRVYYSDGSHTDHDTIFLQRILKVSDFSQDGSFKDFYFHSSPNSIAYGYDSRFQQRQSEQRLIQDESSPYYTDLESYTGIQFCVDWLRQDELCTLYIDYAEVYDNDGWNSFVEDSLTATITAQNIQDYAQSYSNWSNLKYWYAHDEPFTIDAIEPMRIVDSLVRDAGGKPLITAYLVPNWTLINGVKLYKRIFEGAQTEKMMIDYYPFYVGWDVPRSMETLRAMLQETHTELQPGFWCIGQAFGLRTPTNGWCYWRKPDSTELKATVMLSLAHGVKGILFWNYESDYVPQYNQTCSTYVLREGILNENLITTELYDVIKNNFVPRLKSKLGKTLLGLDYSGEYIQLQHFIPTENPVPLPQGYDYLTIGLQATNHDMNWHVGFFDRTNHADDKYFLMTNLWTNSQKQIQVKVTPSVPGYTNYRFRNMEPENNFDVTFTTQSENTLSFPAGEGYLFEVAPVIKYGGKLIANETAGNGMTLYDAISVESGATLTIDGVYNSIADITIKSGGKIETINGGTINFSNGSKLIIDGAAQLSGTASNKLNLNFTTPQNENGVIVTETGALTMTHCSVSNAVDGIKSSSLTGRTIIEKANFVNCSNSAISILGQVSET